MMYSHTQYIISENSAESRAIKEGRNNVPRPLAVQYLISSRPGTKHSFSCEQEIHTRQLFPLTSARRPRSTPDFCMRSQQYARNDCKAMLLLTAPVRYPDCPSSFPTSEPISRRRRRHHHNLNGKLKGTLESNTLK